MERIKAFVLSVALCLPVSWPLAGQSLTITSPLPGDTLSGNSIHEITWTGGSCENVTIKVFWDDVSDQTIATSTPNDGSYSWTVLDGHTEAMYLFLYCGEEIVNTNFLREYSQGTIEVLSPMEKDTLEKGTVNTITWTENVTDDVSIKLYYPGGAGPEPLLTIADHTSGDGDFDWTVPFKIPLHEPNYYRIGIHSLSNPLIYDYGPRFYLSYKGSICVDPYEPNNHIDSASLDAIDPGFTQEPENYATIHGTIHVPGDWDHYLLQVEQPGYLDLLLAHVPDSFDLQLYNEAKDYVAGSFTEGNESINQEVTPGIYYIIVGSLENASSCDVYDLYLTWTTLPFLEVSPNSRSLGPGSSTATFDVSANQEWTATGDTPWLTVTKSSSELLTVEVEENTSSDPRSAEILLSAGSAESVTVVVNQQGAPDPLAITSPQPGDTLMGGSTYEITWTGGTCENVMIKAIWDDISIETIVQSTPNDGSYLWTVLDGHTEPMSLRINCGEEEARLGILREYSLGTIEVTYPEYRDTLEKGTVTTITWNENVGHEVCIKLTDNWSGSGPDYIRTLAESTPGDGSFEWTVPFDIPLSGLGYLIAINSLSDPLIYDYSRSFYLSYKGSICVDPYEPNNHIDSASLDAIDKDFTLSEENYASLHGTIHEAGDRDHYLLQVKHPGTLDIKLYSIKEFDLQLYNGAKEYVAGSFTDERNESIIQEVSPGDYYIIVGSLENASSCDIYDLYLNWTAGPYLEVSPAFRSLGPGSSTTTFEVSTNREWTVSEDAPWLAVTKSSNTLLTVEVEENTASDPRSAEIIISAGTADPVTVLIQQRITPVFEITTGILRLGAIQGDIASFQVTANVEWSLLNQLPWLEVDPVLGYTSSTVEVAALDSNTTGAVRSGALLIAGNDTSYVLTVIQDFVTGNQEKDNPESPVPLIYPNPARDRLHVDLGSPEPSVLVRIFDSRGVQVFHKRFENTVKFDLELNRYPGGIFQMEILHGSRRTIHTFVILSDNP